MHLFGREAGAGQGGGRTTILCVFCLYRGGVINQSVRVGYPFLRLVTMF